MRASIRAVLHFLVRPVIVLSLVAAFLVWISPQVPVTATLQQALIQNQIDAGQGLPKNLLDTPIYGYAVDSDNREAVVAFFDRDFKLHAAVQDRSSGRWEQKIVELDDAAGVGNSIVEMKRTQRYIYLDSHINLSASRLIILSRDLKLRRALFGWELAMLPNESVVYHHSQIHFAPTHSLEISVFNPRTLQEKQIYPPKPFQPVRVSFINRVSEEYRKRGEDWFRTNNHHMNPELFDSRLVDDVTVDAAAKTMSFLVQYGDPDNGGDPLPFSDRVRVTCAPIDSIDRIQCREEQAR